jgi:hypothetical protein
MEVDGVILGREHVGALAEHQLHGGSVPWCPARSATAHGSRSAPCSRTAPSPCYL